MSEERGAALIEALVVGMVLFVATIQIVLTAGRLQVAGDAISEAASVAAVVGARHGDLAHARATAAALSPGSSVAVWEDGEGVHVRVSTSVAIVDVLGIDAHRSLSATAFAAVNPYRSGGDG